MLCNFCYCSMYTRAFSFHVIFGRMRKTVSHNLVKIYIVPHTASTFTFQSICIYTLSFALVKIFPGACVREGIVWWVRVGDVFGCYSCNNISSRLVSVSLCTIISNAVQFFIFHHQTPVIFSLKLILKWMLLFTTHSYSPYPMMIR